MFNEKGIINRLASVELQILTGSLHTVPEVHRLFKWHNFESMARSLGSYREEIAREFYTSYLSTLRGSIDRWARPTKQDPLTSYLVGGAKLIFGRTLSAGS